MAGDESGLGDPIEDAVTVAAVNLLDVKLKQLIVNLQFLCFFIFEFNLIYFLLFSLANAYSALDLVAIVSTL